MLNVVVRPLAWAGRALAALSTALGREEALRGPSPWRSWTGPCPPEECPYHAPDKPDANCAFCRSGG